MEQKVYAISISSHCIEAIQLQREQEIYTVSQEFGNTTWQLDPEETSLSITEKVEYFLDQQEWENLPFILLISCENLIFRHINLPFHDKKKIQQALPFEVENELMEEMDQVHYIHGTDAQKDGTTNIILFALEKDYLESLKLIFVEKDLFLKDIHCSAYTLYKTYPPTAEKKISLQIYFGSDEIFVNVLENQKIKLIKMFSSQVPFLVHQFCYQHQLSIEDFILLLIEEQPSIPEALAEAQELVEDLIEKIKNEVRWLCTQFNLLIRTLSTMDISISLHGVFSVLLQWNQIGFRMYRTFPKLLPLQENSEHQEEETLFTSGEQNTKNQEQAEVSDHSRDTTQDISLNETPSVLQEEEENLNLLNHNTVTDSRGEESKELIATSQQKQEISIQQEVIPIVDYRIRTKWGLIGEVMHLDVTNLQGHQMSFFSEGTPLKRFLVKYRAFLIVSLVLFISSVSVWGVNYSLSRSLLHQEIQLNEQQLLQKLRALLPAESSNDVGVLLTTLEQKIQQKRESQQLEIPFKNRKYTNLTMLNQLSEILDQQIFLKIESFEYSEKRLSLGGIVDSYDSLQLLKNGLQELPQFKEQKISENNRKSPDGIFFKIIVSTE